MPIHRGLLVYMVLSGLNVLINTGVGCEGIFMKEWAEKFYTYKRWRKTKDLVWARDRGLCQRCLERGKIREGRVVHHIVPLTPENVSQPQIAYGLDNLVLLCADCHAEIHRKSIKRYKFDDLGRVIIKE